MTDNEIIKALEYCKDDWIDCKCGECPYAECDTTQGCVGELCADAFDLINRQKAEIERLNGYLDVISYSTSKIEAEAIKEFAERLKEKAMQKFDWNEYVEVEEIDNIVKEMTEQRKEDEGK